MDNPQCCASVIQGQHRIGCINIREGTQFPGQLVPDGGGLRFDEGKVRVDLLPPDALLALGAVYSMGAKKYSDRNWERGMKWSKVIGPLMRHLLAFMSGKDLDKESGLPHMAHVAWNAIALLTYQLRGMEEYDDRAKLEEGPRKG